MSIKYKCNECGSSFPEDLIDYLEKGNQVFCERCGFPFTLVKDKINKRNGTKESLITPDNLMKGRKILMGFILLNFLLVIYFFFFLTLLFNPYVFPGISHGPISYKYIGVFIFIFIIVIGFIEIHRGFKLFRSSRYRKQVLMINTIGYVLIRKVLDTPSTEENTISYHNEIKALKILIPFMYVNFFLVNFYFSLPYNNMIFILEIQFFLFIYIIVYVYHIFIGLIILLKVKKLGYQFLKISSILQLGFYNFIRVLTLFNPRSNFILFLISDTILFYITISIITNKNVLMQYFSLKNRFCHNCGSKLKKHMKTCPTCMEDLSKSKIDSEEVPEKKYVKTISTIKTKSEKERIIAKSSEPVEKSEVVEYSKNLTFVKNEKDKKLLQHYLLERFVVTSEQLRKSINKLNISNKEKMILLKDLSFLTSKEQTNLLELLANLHNN